MVVETVVCGCVDGGLVDVEYGGGCWVYDCDGVVFG